MDGKQPASRRRLMAGRTLQYYDSGGWKRPPLPDADARRGQRTLTRQVCAEHNIFSFHQQQAELAQAETACAKHVCLDLSKERGFGSLFESHHPSHLGSTRAHG